MLGGKSDITEGGIRNFLAVRGPGVPHGIVDSTLMDVTDVLPTIADIAGIEPASSTHLPWDGISFKNLMLPTVQATQATRQAGQVATTSQGRTYRGTVLANADQLGRYLVTMSPSCWHANAVPDLSPNR